MAIPELAPPLPTRVMPTIPEDGTAMSARVRVDTRAAADASAMESPVLTGRRSPPPVASPSVAKLPGLDLAVRASTKRELLLPALFSSLSPAPLAAEDASASASASSSASASASATRRKKGTRRGTLHPEAKSVLKAWMFSPEHFAHPYPSEEEKEELASEAGIEVKQLSNWFTNARKRLWQPVLRQSGVEVKNFLSTGRGGPRGSKLEVPANLQQLVASSLASAAADSPPSSPDRSPLKRSWADMHASLQASPAPSAYDDDNGRDRAPLTKRSRRALLEDAAAAASPASVARFRDVELLAASSLLGLHQQPPPYQPVH